MTLENLDGMVSKIVYAQIVAHYDIMLISHSH